MSGVFAVCFRKGPDGIDAAASEISARMRHHDWYVTETFSDPQNNLAIGRVGINIFNRTPQPVENQDGSIVLFLTGEIYPPRDKPREKPAKAPEKIALEAYQEYGENFARRLRGAFAILILDKKRKRIIFTNDRFGLYPHYYSNWQGNFVIAPEVKAITGLDLMPLKLDMASLAQYMRLQQLFGRRTFFEDIYCLPGACVLTYDITDGQAACRSYWGYSDIPFRPQVTFNQAVEETGYLLRGAVRELSEDEYRPGVFLSGGLDSRTILGLTQRRPIVTMTWGNPICRDRRYAQQIAQAMHSQHHAFDMTSGQWVIDHYEEHLRLTEGFHSWIHSHGIHILPEARQLIDVNLTGWDGGTVMGHPDSMSPIFVSPVDETAFRIAMFEYHNQKITWPSITEAEERFLYTQPYAQAVSNLAFDSFTQELAPFWDLRRDTAVDLFFLDYHTRRMTVNMVTTARSHIEVRFPYFDYDLIDFLYSLPTQVRGPRSLYRAVIQKETPRLAYIPYNQDNLLPTTRQPVKFMSDVVIKGMRRINKILDRNRPQDTLYADYEEYLRDDLRAWAEGILFDPRTEGRGIFNPAFIRSIWARHQSRQEQWTVGKIAPIMTFELMLRQFCD
jgi:asparagine synthase (glutamine-hydrolysing)